MARAITLQVEDPKRAYPTAVADQSVENHGRSFRFWFQLETALSPERSLCRALRGAIGWVIACIPSVGYAISGQSASLWAFCEARPWAYLIDMSIGWRCTVRIFRAPATRSRPRDRKWARGLLLSSATFSRSLRCSVSLGVKCPNTRSALRCISSPRYTG